MYTSLLRSTRPRYDPGSGRLVSTGGPTAWVPKPRVLSSTTTSSSPEDAYLQLRHPRTLGDTRGPPRPLGATTHRPSGASTLAEHLSVKRTLHPRPPVSGRPLTPTPGHPGRSPSLVVRLLTPPVPLHTVSGYTYPLRLELDSAPHLSLRLYPVPTQASVHPTPTLDLRAGRPTPPHPHPLIVYVPKDQVESRTLFGESFPFLHRNNPHTSFILVLWRLSRGVVSSEECPRRGQECCLPDTHVYYTQSPHTRTYIHTYKHIYTLSYTHKCTHIHTHT